MGNLYTHIVKQKGDERLTILSELKQIFRSYPRDEKRIKELRGRLKLLEPKKTAQLTLKQKYGLFAWKNGG